jgi:hypothetical protein
MRKVLSRLTEEGNELAGESYPEWESEFGLPVLAASQRVSN